MFVTTYHWGIVVVCGQDGGIYVEKVLFDQEFWSPVLAKLDLFLTQLFYPSWLKYGLPRVAPGED